MRQLEEIHVKLFSATMTVVTMANVYLLESVFVTQAIMELIAASLLLSFLDLLLVYDFICKIKITYNHYNQKYNNYLGCRMQTYSK